MRKSQPKLNDAAIADAIDRIIHWMALLFLCGLAMGIASSWKQ